MHFSRNRSAGLNIRISRILSLRRAGFAVVCCLLVAACSGQALVSDRQVARDRVDTYLAAHPGTDRNTATDMRRFELRSGMTKQEVVAVWGRPVEMQKWRSGAVDQWFFACAWPNRCEAPDRDVFLMGPIRPEAFFRDGRLIEWSSP